MPQVHFPKPGFGVTPVFLGIIFLGTGVGVGCSYIYQKNPFTNRRQFVFIGKRFEKYLGKMMSSQFTSKLKNSNSEIIEAKKYIEKLVSHLVSNYKTYKKEEWDINVLPSKEVNAFAIPGGQIFVYTGLLKFCKSADEVAFVLSHEISHVEARHSAERLSLLLPILGLGMAISYYFAQDYDWIFNMVFKYIIELPQSRFSEYEADKMAIGICKKTGFDVIKGAEFFKRGDSLNLDFLSTHPSHEHRLAKIFEEEKKVNDALVNETSLLEKNKKIYT